MKRSRDDGPGSNAVVKRCVRETCVMGLARRCDGRRGGDARGDPVEEPCVRAFATATGWSPRSGGRRRRVSSAGARMGMIANGGEDGRFVGERWGKRVLWRVGRTRWIDANVRAATGEGGGERRD